MPRNITNIQKVATKGKSHKVVKLANGGYKVTSGASGRPYYVRLSPRPSCTCKWADYQPRNAPVACSHVLAAKAYETAQNSYKAKFRAIGEDVRRLHRRTAVIGNGVKLTMRKV